MNINPNIMASYTAALFLAIIIVGLYSNVDKKVNRGLVYFRACVLLCLAGLLSDGTIYVMASIPSMNHLTPVFTYLAYVLTNGLLIVFALYYQSIAQKDSDRMSKIILSEIVLSCIDFVLFTFGSLTGKIIYSSQSNTITGPWYMLTVTLRILCIGILFLYVMKVRKTIGPLYTVVLSSLFIFYVVTCILGFIIPIFKSNYVATAFAAVMSYVFIQSKNNAEANVRAEAYNSLSVLDFLTGIKNRRGFHEMEKDLDPAAEVAALFCDINGLKKMNDNYGHDAGDHMIQRVANLLTENFPDGESFRISGDEFLVIVKLSESLDIDERAAQFRMVLSDNDDIAALGYSQGRASELKLLVRQAEADMYAEKKRYYERKAEAGRH